MQDKQALRKAMRAKRREFVTSMPEALRGLILNRPPQAVVDLLADCATLGLYYPTAYEAPSLGWARWFAEQGKRICLPRFEDDAAPMQFGEWPNPWDDDALEAGPHGMLQPDASAPGCAPDALIVPLVAFTADGHRLGQGGGHYDRWLAENGSVTTIGLAWDVQLLDALPLEAHDRKLDAVVTPTQIFRSE